MECAKSNFAQFIRKNSTYKQHVRKSSAALVSFVIWQFVIWQTRLLREWPILRTSCVMYYYYQILYQIRIIDSGKVFQAT